MLHVWAKTLNGLIGYSTHYEFPCYIQENQENDCTTEWDNFVKRELAYTAPTIEMTWRRRRLTSGKKVGM